MIQTNGTLIGDTSTALQRPDLEDNMDPNSQGPSRVSVQLHRLRAIPSGTAEQIPIIRSILPHISEVESIDAQYFIDVLDGTLDSAQVDPDLFRRCFRALRKICGSTGVLPTSHMLTERLTKSGDVPAASGGFADVWDGNYQNSRVAIKSLRIYRTDDQEALRKTFCKEVVLWKRLSHPNILPLYGVSTSLFPFCMVSPWMKNGNVTEYVLENSGVNRVQLLVDVSRGLDFLHSLEIVHGDLKGANILINESQRAYLADFGLTTIISNLNSLNPSTFVSRPSGTVRWMAPETLDPEMFDIPVQPNRGFSKASDVYAFAMVVVETFTGRIPFPEFRSDPSVIVKVMQGGRPARPGQSNASGLSDRLWELVQLCWQQDRTQRPTISMVLNQLEAILYNGSPPPRAVVYKTPLDHTCVDDSSSSVGLPVEATSIAATSRGEDAHRSDPSDPVLTHPDQSSGLNRNTALTRFTKWPRRIFRGFLSCIIS